MSTSRPIIPTQQDQYTLRRKGFSETIYWRGSQPQQPFIPRFRERKIFLNCAMLPFWKKRIKPPPTDLVGGPYHALPDNRSIRYMVLESGKDDEALVCSLRISRLRKMPYFEAISYVWGSDDRTHEILCDGEIVKITTNLHDVLRRVRLANASRTLWADSICINQDDGVEKGEQVRLMGAIFSKADRVLVCVGENEDGHAERAGSLVSELNDMIWKDLLWPGNHGTLFLGLNQRRKSDFCLMKEGSPSSPSYSTLGSDVAGLFRKRDFPRTP